jgi:hypothetical protein
LGPYERICTAFAAVEIAEDAGAGGGEAVDAAIELGLEAIAEGAVELGLGGEGDGEDGVGHGGALSVDEGNEVRVLGVAEASDAPVNVDELVDELDFGGGGGAPVGELLGGDGVEGVAGFRWQEGVIEGEGGAAEAGLAGGGGAAGAAGVGFGAAGLGAVGAVDGGALFGS